MYKIISLVISIFFITVLVAQDNLTFEHYSRKNGLTDNYITDVCEDSIGRIWITTAYGINTFNGKNFTPIIREDSYYTSLVRNDMTFVNKDLQGNLWFGGFNGTMVQYDYIKDEFIDVSLNHISLHEYPIFFNTYQIPGSELYGLSEYGLFRYSKYSKKFHKAFREIHDIPGRRFTSMYIDSKKQIWLGSQEKGLFCISSDSTQTHIFDFSKDVFSQPPRVNEFVPINDSTFLIATSRGIFNITHTSFGKITSKLICKELQNIFISSIIKDKKGNIWIGTGYKGLWLLSSNGKFQRVTTLQSDNTLATTISTIYEDSGNRIWIGTQDYGLFCYNPEKQKTHKISSKNGLKNNMVSAIITDEKGNIWVGTDGGGISIYTSDYKHIKNINSDNATMSDGVLCFEQDSKFIWAGTWRGGLIRINKTDFSITSYTTENSELLYNGIKTLSWLSKDTLLIGTHRNGIQALIIKTNKIISDLGFKYSTYFPIEQKFINQIITDKNGVIWVATIRNLYCIANKKIIDIIENDNHTFPHNPIYISSISEDKNGYIIAATNKGVYKISTKTLKKEKISDYIPELKNAFVFSAFVSSSNNYWLSSTNGLFEYMPSNKSYKKITLSYFVNRFFYTQRAIYEDLKGRLFFGTNEGMYSFSPKILFQDDSNLKLYFSNLFIAYKKVKPGTIFLPIQLSISSKIELPHNCNIWGISFQTICFDSPESIEYEYMLKGFDMNWNHLGTSQEITFTNIPPGKYTLLVKAWQQNSKNATIKSIEIIIFPPWWKTWWFRIGITIVIIGLLYLIYSLRLYTLRKEKQKLEQEVKKQTGAIEEQKEQIEEQNVELRFFGEKLEESNKTLIAQNYELEDLTKQLQDESIKLTELNKTLYETNETKSQLFSIITNDIRNSFISLQTLSNSLQNEFETISVAQKKNLLSTISQGIFNTKELLENLIFWAKSQTNTIEIKPEYFKIEDIYNEIQATFNHIILEKNISLTCTNKNAEIVFADKQMIISVIRNLLHASIQNTPTGGFIMCSAQLIHANVEIQIQDSGNELNEEILNALLKITKKSTGKHKEKINATGIALIVCQQFIEKNNGVLTISNTSKKGFIYKITLPTKPIENEIEAIMPQANLQEKEYCVAIIDDNSAILLLLGEFLKKEYKIEMFSESQEFLQNLSIALPNLVICDIFMPGFDGYTICKKIKSNPKTQHIPVILISSDHEDATKQQAYENGADVFIEKPISKQVLATIVKKVLNDSVKQKSNFNTQNPITFDTISNEDFFKKFDEILRKNISNPDYSIQEISNELHVSRTHLFRKVKQVYAISPKDYFIKIRMQAAAELLQYKDTKIIDIAYATGFNDPSYFSKCFHKQYGVNPSDYKDSLLRSESDI